MLLNIDTVSPTCYAMAKNADILIIRLTRNLRHMVLVPTRDCYGYVSNRAADSIIQIISYVQTFQIQLKNNSSHVYL